MLTAKQVERYRRDGYLFRLPALSLDELSVCNEGLGRFEHWLGSPLTEGDCKWRSAGYVFCLGSTRWCAIPASSTRLKASSAPAFGHLAACPLMRSKVRAYSHQGHGPRADQQIP
jgi:hypothetical protein